MVSIKNNYSCCGCTACSNVCPSQCISMVKDSEGFFYPLVDAEKCIGCGMCEKVCPFDEKKQSMKKEPLMLYAIKSRDDDIRNKSTSGGVFPIIANSVLLDGGVVFGACMSLDCRSVEHIKVDQKEDLHKLQGSKYIQSRLNSVFKDVKKLLQDNKKVLFSGTPCQISGLHYYLGKNFDNLFTFEVVCHGVPSELLWQKYLEYLESKYKGTAVYVGFREKTNSKKQYEIINQNKVKTVCTPYIEDPYIGMFLKDICLRPSCYQCLAKKGQSKSDFTAGDYWGAKQDVPAMDDGNGISILFVNTEKGLKLFNQISKDFVYAEADYTNAVKHNRSYNYSSPKPKERVTFYEDLNNYSFGKIMKKYYKISFKNKLKIIIKRSWLFTTIRHLKKTKSKSCCSKFKISFKKF